MRHSNFLGKVHIILADISPALIIQIFLEALFYPLLILYWAVWNRFSPYIPFPKITKSLRKTEEEEKVVICLHDWMGYAGERTKTLKNGSKFKCGRSKILREMAYCKNKIPSEIIVSLSGNGEYDFDPQSVKTVLKVENQGLDFRGYSIMLCEILKEPGNPFVVLMNSSVAGGFYDSWLDDYCSVLKNDRSIGLLGISTGAHFIGLLKNHFVPHLQSFFLISTKEVLSKILQCNKGMLPGANERNKYRLIQKGEIGLSMQILKLGYTIAAVQHGGVLRFRLKNRFNNNIHGWPFPLEDIRLTSENSQAPNTLSKLKQ